MTTIYVDEKMKGLGFSGVNQYNDQFFHLALGSTNGYDRTLEHHPNYKTGSLWVQDASVIIYISEEQYDIVARTIKEKRPLPPVLWNIFKEQISMELFFKAIAQAYERGHDLGKEAKAQEFRDVLGV